MRDGLTYGVRPGYYGFGMGAVVGLALLAASLLTLVPRVAGLIVMPALVISIREVRRRPPTGLRTGRETWHVLDGHRMRPIPRSRIAHIRVRDIGAQTQATLVLTDGEECDLPIAMPSGALSFIRDVTALNVPVRAT